MITRFIEATDATRFNWGKFMLARFTPEEWQRRSALDDRPQLRCRGWDAGHLLILDLQTGEGSMFRPGGCAQHDLNERHCIWVCPMFEPFLEWLYKQDLSDLDALPELVDLCNVPTSLSGYRRSGKVLA